MKTLIASLIALGLLSGVASAEWCAPGYGYGHRTTFGYGSHRPAYSQMPKVVAEAPAPIAAAPAPEAPAPVEAAPAPEALPPK